MTPRWRDRLLALLAIIAIAWLFRGDALAFTTIPLPSCPPVITEPTPEPRPTDDA